MELVNIESGKICGDDDPCIQTLEVVEDQTYQMTNHEIIEHIKKTQHANKEVMDGIAQSPWTRPTIEKKS